MRLPFFFSSSDRTCTSLQLVLVQLAIVLPLNSENQSRSENVKCNIFMESTRRTVHLRVFECNPQLGARSVTAALRANHAVRSLLKLSKAHWRVRHLFPPPPCIQEQLDSIAGRLPSSLSNLSWLLCDPRLIPVSHLDWNACCRPKRLCLDPDKKCTAVRVRL